MSPPLVTTVLGPISPEVLGPTLMHEHILFDVSVLRRLLLEQIESRRASATDESERRGIAELDQGPTASRDNTLQRDLDVAEAELMQLKHAGGRTIVDVTCTGLAPDPSGLAELAGRTGLNIVASTGYYVGASHPAELSGRSPGAVADELTRHLTDGFPGTTVRAGVIGEIGTSEPLAPTEEIVLRACGRAQAQTGAPIVFHPDASHRSYDSLGRTLDLLERSGARLDRVVISHCDERFHTNPSDYRRLTALGCILGFDTFGKEHHNPARRRQHPSDARRIEVLASLVADGLARSIVLSQDVCYKGDLVTWGGPGYGHVFRSILPRLRERGVPDSAIEQMTVENPRRLLSVG